MKKILTFIILNIILISNVSASENKLYFTDSGDRIYYDSELFDENLFMKHTDMTPGSQYHDTLTIKNESDTEYTLFFKVKEKEQSSEAKNLLENISMTIYLDKEIIYEGLATGLECNNSGVNLQNAISLGKFKPDSIKKMDVKIKLNESYSDNSGNNLAHIEWEFYASYGESLSVIEPVPDTGIDKSEKKKIIITSLLGIIILFILILMLNSQKKRKLS